MRFVERGSRTGEWVLPKTTVTRNETRGAHMVHSNSDGVWRHYVDCTQLRHHRPIACPPAESGTTVLDLTWRTSSVSLRQLSFAGLGPVLTKSVFQTAAHRDWSSARRHAAA